VSPNKIPKTRNLKVTLTIFSASLLLACSLHRFRQSSQSSAQRGTERPKGQSTRKGKGRKPHVCEAINQSINQEGTKNLPHQPSSTHPSTTIQHQQTTAGLACRLTLMLICLLAGSSFLAGSLTHCWFFNVCRLLHPHRTRTNTTHTDTSPRINTTHALVT
jgi:hypothetical protein